MKYLMYCLTLLLISCAQGNSQNSPGNNDLKVGGPCEGCEGVDESPVPLHQLPSLDTLPDFSESGERIRISGTVYQQDGKTPARDVVIYVYHTNQQGLYPTENETSRWGKRHGAIRGWMKTNERGQYEFYTLRPASYPNSNNPQHIHVMIKEPGKTAYWIDDFHFADDPLFTASMRSQQQERGGSGLLKLETKEGMKSAQRNIILGKNIPGYPAADH